ncbi:xpo4, partial [Linum perenne]
GLLGERLSENRPNKYYWLLCHVTISEAVAATGDSIFVNIGKLLAVSFSRGRFFFFLFACAGAQFLHLVLTISTRISESFLGFSTRIFEREMIQQQLEGGVPDLAHLQSTMHAIELACSSIQMHTNSAAAEATLLSLNQATRPYKLCQFILENSQVANARFQAAAAIRDAAIREWSSLPADDKKGLIGFCLCYVMQRASSPEGYVQAKVSSVAAQLMKRGWLEHTVAEKETFFYQVNQAIIGIHGLDVQFTGINFLESLVSEFSPSTSSAMGLPREFHEQCRKSLELHYLKTFYCWAKDAAVSVATRITESDTEVPEAKVCTAALRLMLQILNWEFQPKSTPAKAGINAFSPGIRTDTTATKRSDCHVAQLGPAWRDALLTSGHIGWIVSLYAALREKFSAGAYWLDCPIAVSARKLIVQFCSVTGSIFVSGNDHMQENHLVQLLSGIMHWIDPPHTIAQAIESGRSESEMLDGCRALLSMATVANSILFDNLLKSIRPFGTLTLLSNLMSEVIKVQMTKRCDEETWSWEARDILLDTWTILLTPIEPSGGNAMIPPDGINAAANVFAFIAESELKAASASALDEDDGSDYLQASISSMDERLISYALIGRAAVNVTIPLLSRLFSERVALLHQGRHGSNTNFGRTVLIIVDHWACTCR